MNSNEKGFTLLEMLVVLAILFIIVFCIFPLNFSLQEKIQEDHFLNILKRDLYYGHTYAITNQKNVTFMYRWEENSYDLRVHNQPILKRKLPEEISFRPSQDMNRFSFHPNGNISNFGTLTFYVGNNKYKVIFTIGKGRFRIEKEI